METVAIARSQQTTMNSADSNLSIADKDRCNQVFETYNNHISHVRGLLNFITQKHSKFLEQRNEGDDSFSLKKVDSAIEELNDTIQNLTRSFIVKIENYFKKRYCLFFESLLMEKKEVATQSFTSFDTIINNIAHQVGNDFLKAGKEQIRNRFLKCFHLDRLPSLRGNKITIPDFIRLDEHYGSKISLSYNYNSSIDKLIDALNLFLNDDTELPESIPEKILGWRNILDLSEQYTVFPDVSFKFFKNQRIDILFSSPAIARRFWNFYKLEIIEKIINENK